MKPIKMDTYAGDNFNIVAKKAHDLANDTKQDVEFDFNGITCIVNKDTDTGLLYRDYANAHRMEWKNVGPDCKAEYSKEVQSELERRNKLAEEKREKERLEYEQKCDKSKAAFQKSTEGIEIELLDKSAYQDWKDKQTDGYSKAVFEFAEGWAKLMQIQIAKGVSVKDCAEKTSFKFDWLGLSGAQYGFAVAVLSKCWKHGEELRKWHNKEYNHEGDGVVNPAVLTIG